MWLLSSAGSYLYGLKLRLGKVTCIEDEGTGSSFSKIESAKCDGGAISETAGAASSLKSAEDDNDGAEDTAGVGVEEAVAGTEKVSVSVSVDAGFGVLATVCRGASGFRVF